MKPKFFQLAEKLAEKSTHYNHKHGAVLVRKGRVLGVGFNSYKTSPKSPHPWKFIHAEFSAILNSRLEDFTDCEIYIIRTKKLGGLGNSKPCKFCERMIKSLNIRVVHYSTDFNDFKTEKYL